MKFAYHLAQQFECPLQPMGEAASWRSRKNDFSNQETSNRVRAAV